VARKYGFSFSWKRALGISGAKASISRKIGIPLTRSGRERKLGRMMTGGKCFIATVCFADPNHRVVITLRAFRDQVLRRHPTGRRLIASYYRHGPAFAALIGTLPWLRSICRYAIGLLSALISAMVRRGVESGVDRHEVPNRWRGPPNR
jgi:hypothetical protein